MSYFTEILADSGDGFRALDVDVRDANDLDDLVDMMRSAAGDDGEAVAVIEHEDEWFGLVRLCSNNEVKIFLSDLAAVEASPFAEIFADFLDSRPDAYDAEPEEDFGAEEDEGTIAEDDGDDEEVEMLEFDADAEWGGDADIYSDRGVPAATLIDQVESYRSDPARVVAHVGETVGFADQLEAAR
ncbi:tRNA adenosine deaminase-associated protein [Brevibacterium linens]|uniref:tRNA adenosine deaminase-associated protein n=1 Tax=Brevibacterium linens TaxID=1703 RepID=UPI003BF5AEAE